MAEEHFVNSRPRRPPTHPGALLREDVLPALNLSVSEAARQLRIPRQTLHRLLSGTCGVSPEMALRLGKFCGNGPQLWLRMQQNYDLWQAEQRLGPEVEQIPTHLVTSPAKAGLGQAETEASIQRLRPRYGDLLKQLAE